MAETLGVTGGASTMLANKFEPKRKFRWIVEIEGVDAFLAKTANRPTMTFEEITIDWINTKRYLAGKHAFETLSVTLYDPIAPSGAQQVMEWVRLNFEVVSGRSGYADFYKRDLRFKLLDPVGTVVELWDVKGAMISSATFGSLDYSGDETVTIDLTLKFDNCVLQF